MGIIEKFYAVWTGTDSVKLLKNKKNKPEKNFKNLALLSKKEILKFLFWIMNMHIRLHKPAESVKKKKRFFFMTYDF